MRIVHVHTLALKHSICTECISHVVHKHTHMHMHITTFILYIHEFKKFSPIVCGADLAPPSSLAIFCGEEKSTKTMRAVE